MDLSKSFAAATEDSLDDNKFGYNRGVHVTYASQKPSKPKRASDEQCFSKPVPVFYREVDFSDFPQDIPRTLSLGSFLNDPVPRDSMPRSSSSLNSE